MAALHLRGGAMDLARAHKSLREISCSLDMFGCTDVIIRHNKS